MARRSKAWPSLLLRFAWDGLRGHRGRSSLTMFGMAIGTAAVVGVVSIGLVGREYVVSLIEGVGSNLVFAYGTGYGVNPEDVTFEDYEAITQRVHGIQAVAPVIDEMQTISVRNTERMVKVLGSTASYADVRNLKTVSGRFFTPYENETADKVAVISKDLAKEILGGEPARGQPLRLFDLKFRVVGVFTEGTESAAAMEKSEAAGLTALIPFTTLKNMAPIRFLDVIYVQAVDRAAVPGVVEGVRGVLESNHRSLDNFTIESLNTYLVLAEQVSNALSLGLVAIAGISLIVGGIGIMNIMLVTVTERTRDIGIRLALGAGRRDILSQFLLEAGILSVSGGTLGVLLGAVLPVCVGWLYDFSVPISALSVVVAFSVSVSVGLFFGLYPARLAANMNIVDALGYEA